MKKMILVLFLTLLIRPVYCPLLNGEAKRMFDIYILDKFINPDAYVKKLMAVLKIKEGGHNYQAVGRNGEIGAYQFMPDTWRRLCIRFYKRLKEPTKENQDKLAKVTLESYIDKEYSIEQIAAIWNSGDPNSRRAGINSAGVPYDVGAYVKDFVRVFKSLKELKEKENPIFFYPGLRLCNDI